MISNDLIFHFESKDILVDSMSIYQIEDIQRLSKTQIFMIILACTYRTWIMIRMVNNNNGIF